MLKKSPTQNNKLYLRKISLELRISVFTSTLSAHITSVSNGKQTVQKNVTTAFSFVCRIQEAVNMAAQLFDCAVPLKVFSFRDNADYVKFPRVSEAPFQQVSHFRSLLYFNLTATLNTILWPFFERVPGWFLVWPLTFTLWLFKNYNEFHSSLI